MGSGRPLEKYLKEARDKNGKPLTKQPKFVARNAAISFYKHNWRALNGEVAIAWKFQAKPKKRSPKLGDTEDLEASAKTVRDKAIIWFLPTSAFRIGTALSLLRSDLKPTGDNEVPFYLDIEAERLKGARIGKYEGIHQITLLICG